MSRLTSQSSSAFLLLGATAGLIAALAALEHLHLPRTPTPEVGLDVTTVAMRPELRRALALGYRVAASDGYLMQAIQYYGTREEADNEYRMLPVYMEASLSLDPDFEYGYQFIGQSGPVESRHAHGWVNVGASIALLERSQERPGKRWQVPWLLGYLLYTFRGDYVRAGNLMHVAASRPRAPDYLSEFSARLLAQGGDLATAREFTLRALAQTTDPKQRAEIEDRVKSLSLQGELEVLNKAVESRRSTGLPVKTIDDLVGTDGIAQIPPDPFGGAFSFDPASGKVTSQHSDRLLKLRIHPGSPPIEKALD